MTTVESVQESVNQAQRARFGARINHHRFAMPLLGDNEGIEAGDAAGAFGTAGSPGGGVTGRASPAPGLTVLGGVSLSEDSRASYRLEDLAMFALAVRYVHPLGDNLSLGLTAGGWYAHDGTIELSRSYLNGFDTTTATSGFSGHDRYLFARLALHARPGPDDLVALSGEIGSQRWQTDGFAEETSNANPFPAIFGEEHGRMGVAKARAGWTRSWGSRVSTSLWAGGAWTFERRSDLLVGVDGIGVLAPRLGGFDWAEYGARIGYRLSERLDADLFVNGVKGEDLPHQAHIGLRLSLRL